MKTTITILALAAAVAATAPAAAQKASQLPKRPEEIKFKPLAFNAPQASD